MMLGFAKPDSDLTSARPLPDRRLQRVQAYIDTNPLRHVSSSRGLGVVVPQRYHNPVSLPAPPCPFESDESLIKALFCLPLCPSMSPRVLERVWLRIRRSQVRVLPSALLKVLQNVGIQEDPGDYTGGFGSSRLDCVRTIDRSRSCQRSIHTWYVQTMGLHRIRFGECAR